MALIGGGIGITPIWSLLEAMDGDLAVVYRVISANNVIFGEETAGLSGYEAMTILADGRVLFTPRFPAAG